jgi:hypothetical protein
MDYVRSLTRWGLFTACLLDAVSEATLDSPDSTRNTCIAIVSAAALVVNRRIGAAITAAGLLFTLHTSHEFLVLSVAALVAIFPSPRQLVLLLKVQLTVLWVFAGIAKLQPAFRSGSILERGHVLLLGTLPEWVFVWGTILAEAIVLPVLLWTRPRAALWCGIAFQLAIIVAMSTYESRFSTSRQISFLTALLSFGLMTITCIYVVTMFEIRNRPATVPDQFA